MTGIYCITNKINGKKYIGQSIEIISRWNDHIRHAAADADTAIGRDIFKFGVSLFTFEVLEICCREELNSKEAYYISKFNTIKNGYNDCLTGYGRKILNIDILNKIKKDLKDNKVPIYEIAKKYNCDRHLISKINVGKRFYNPNESYPLRPFGASNTKRNLYGKRIAQYTKDGIFLKNFNSIAEAKDILFSNAGRGVKNQISNCCAGRAKTAYGYIWKYVEEE